MPEWSFVTNHGAVLVLVATRPRVTAREVAAALGITERSVFRIVRELEDAGYLRRAREGRVNRYQVDADLPLPGTMLRDVAVRDLLAVVGVLVEEPGPS